MMYLYAPLIIAIIYLLAYYILLPFLNIFYVYFIASNIFSGRRKLRKHGDWAVVTGATDGIGQAYVHELAKDGFNIVLIDRSETKLIKEANHIESRFNVKTMLCVVDFAQQANIYGDIKDALHGLDIGILVNNVGTSYPHPIFIYDEEILSDMLMKDMINSNVTSVLMMIRLVLPGMIARGEGGVIVNISSSSASEPMPYISLYSASKAFVDFLSRGLAAEIVDHPQIIVQSVLPFSVASNQRCVNPDFYSPTPLAFVRSALKLIGIEHRTSGCFAHALQAFYLSLLPGFVLSWYAESCMKSWMQRAVQERIKSK